MSCCFEMKICVGLNKLYKSISNRRCKFGDVNLVLFASPKKGPTPTDDAKRRCKRATPIEDAKLAAGRMAAVAAVLYSCTN